MIVATNFPSDSHKAASAQHVVYQDALNVIVNNCNRFALFARHVLRSEDNQNWGTICKFDHRILQFQHDLLATVWRYQTQASQLRLDCDEDEKSIQLRWLDWLKAEVGSWIERPEWVSLVQVILENQNTRLGQDAETLLSLRIMEHFSDVPWDIKLRLAFEREIEKHQT